MNKASIIKSAISGLLAVAVMALAGCAGAPVKQDIAFFPPAPEEPKLQFLKGIGGAKDIEQVETGVGHSLKVFATGEEGESRPIVKPYGLRYFNGKLYICDIQGHSVAIIDAANKTYSTFEGKGSGKLKKPLNVAVDTDGSMYVVDAGKNFSVIHFDHDGGYVSTIDITPYAPKDKAENGIDFKAKATDVAVDEQFVYVLDMTFGDIKVFDKKTEKYVRSIGSYVEGKGGLSMPSNMMLAPDGNFYVTNMASGSVVIISKKGDIVNTFGKLGDGFGQFGRPKGIAVGQEGRIWVADGVLQNVQIFNKEKHRLLINFGDPGLTQGSLNLPTGIALTSDAQAVGYWQQLAAPGFILEEIAFVANQAGPAKVSVYGLGHRQAVKTSDLVASPAAAKADANSTSSSSVSPGKAAQ